MALKLWCFDRAGERSGWTRSKASWVTNQRLGCSTVPRRKLALLPQGMTLDSSFGGGGMGGDFGYIPKPLLTKRNNIVVYSVRGLERSELGGSHGCPGRLWNRFL